MEEEDLISGDGGAGAPVRVAKWLAEDVVDGGDEGVGELKADDLLGVVLVNGIAGALMEASIGGGVLLGGRKGLLVSRGCALVRSKWSRQTAPACKHTHDFAVVDVICRHMCCTMTSPLLQAYACYMGATAYAPERVGTTTFLQTTVFIGNACQMRSSAEAVR
jgi:hypothetical protein